MIEAELDKQFGAREVLHAARLVVRPGSVHALVGENGAGKSTLVRLIAGVLGGARGRLVIAGTPIDLARWDRKRARAAGIGIVQQHGSFANTLSVVENAVLGSEPGSWLALDATARALAERGDAVGLPIDPWAEAGTLSLGAAQRAEIVTALHHGAKLLILDEPTAVLAPREVEGLLDTLRGLAQIGTTIVLVTHKLDEVRAVADDVTVLRTGETVATFAANRAAGAVRFDVRAIAEAMVGSALPDARADHEAAGAAPEALAISNVSVGNALVDVSLSIRGTEIVGVAGIDGNGQRELAHVIAGLVAPTGGEIWLGRTNVTELSPARRLALGLGHVPEDRLHGGVVLDATIADNLALGRSDITGRWRIDRRAVERHARTQIAELAIRPDDPLALVKSLSGGNQQKVVIGRELSRPNLRALVAAQPTRGVDLGAVKRIHERLREAARAGAGVLVISTDLDELLTICHRIVVVLRGRIVGEQLAGNPDARLALAAMMTGAEAA
ncbi:MAG: ABC transporter ATP-binding protein [Kofleriaceae bacterium]